MKKRYIPFIINSYGCDFIGAEYSNLADAMDGLEEFVNNFKSYRDDIITDTYVLNTITGKKIRP